MNTLRKRQRGSLEERFLAKAVIGSSWFACWGWTDVLTAGGYASLKFQRKTYRGCRIAYQLAYGEIPEGLHVDHLCRNRACVNPLHLEPVTKRVNDLRGQSPLALNSRKTHCVHGHEFTTANTYHYKGGRCCRRCTANSQQAYQARKKAISS